MLTSLAVLVLRTFPLWWPFPRGKGIAARCLLTAAKLGLIGPGWAKQDGFWLWTDIEDFNQRETAMGAFDKTVLAATKACLSKGDVFIDIGANIGYLSLIASRQTGPTGRVVAFEPNPATAEVLRQNLRRNEAANVSVREMACSDRSGSVDFFTGTKRHSGRASLSQENSGGTAVVRAQCCVLDDVLENEQLPGIALIKADTEGAELSVLAGAKETIRKYRPIVLVEVDSNLLSAFDAKPADISQFFEELGYSFSPIGTTNWLFRPGRIWRELYKSSPAIPTKRSDAAEGHASGF